MRKGVVVILVLLVLGGCAANRCTMREAGVEKSLTLRWQRLVDEDGKTCERCDLTEKEVEKAFQSLKKSLAPLGIKVTLQENVLDSATVARDVSRSNLIWVGDQPLEKWLGAEVGKSPCASCCEKLGSNVECRTVKIEGKTYEAIPADLIVKAGLLAASELLDKPDEPCCPSECPTGEESSNCCPDSGRDSKKDE